MNLDFADLFKPLIVDRIIFSLVNRGQLHQDDFVKQDNGGIYLQNDSKRQFIQEFHEKMMDQITVKNQKVTYHQLIMNEIHLYQKHILEEEKYKPYKYY